VLKTIKDYLNQVEKVIINLHQDKSLVEEYESHLMAQFDDFLKENPTGRKTELEEHFIAQLEDPEIIAHSLIEREPEIERVAIFPFQLRRIKRELNRFFTPLSQYYNTNVLTAAILTFIFLIAPSISLIWINLYLIWPLFPEETLIIDITRYFIILLFIVVFFYLGFKNPFSEIIKTSFFFTILLIAFLILMRYPDKLQIIINRIHIGSPYQYDWTNITLPDLLEYFIYLLGIIITQLLFLPAVSITMASLGYLTKLIMTKKLVFNTKKFHRSSINKFVLIFLCITVYFLLPDTSRQLPRYFLNSYSNTPPSDPSLSPLLYYIFIEPGTSNYDPFPSYGPFITKVKEFGNFSCREYTVYKVSFTQNDFSRINSSYTASFVPVNPDEGKPSEFQFPILGSLFLDPKNIPIINPDILNSSFPFAGLNPTQNFDVNKIGWGDARVGKIPVINIKYTSVTNNIYYTFHFDKRTGWLMQATLSRIEGSWYDSYYGYHHLVLTRMFFMEKFDQIDDYRFLEMMFSMSILIITSGVIIYSYQYYKKKAGI
jgi:hypothetical protein